MIRVFCNQNLLNCIHSVYKRFRPTKGLLVSLTLPLTQGHRIPMAARRLLWGDWLSIFVPLSDLQLEGESLHLNELQSADHLCKVKVSARLWTGVLLLFWLLLVNVLPSVVPVSVLACLGFGVSV